MKADQIIRAGTRVEVIIFIGVMIALALMPIIVTLDKH
jgi:hypothetical protein